MEMKFPVFLCLCFCVGSKSLFAGSPFRVKPQTSFDSYQYPIPDFPPQFDDPNPPEILYGPPNRPTTAFPPLQDIPQNPIYIPPPVATSPPLQDIPFNPVYIPPAGYPDGKPPISLEPPQFDPIPTDDTLVIPAPPNNGQYLPPPPSNSYGTPLAPQIRILNMSCLDTSTQRYFRATVRTSQVLENPLVVEDFPSDCVVGTGDTYRLDWDGNRLIRCGVRYCASAGERGNMCVGVRIPSVRGLKLPEDTLLTLQCRPQERVVSLTRQLNVHPQIIQGRSAPRIAVGGTQRNFNTQISLFRKSSGSNEFSSLITPGSIVHLGEELLLRTAVKDGDGWRFSRMSDVVMHRVSADRKLNQDSVILVNNVGCRDIRMKTICPNHPSQVSPLVNSLEFRAFMFQGMSNGGEMVLSVRMTGCLQQDDCFRGWSCDDKSTRHRSKREVSSNVTNWESYLEFRVADPESRSNSGSVPDTSNTRLNLLIFMVVTGALFSLAMILVITYYRSKCKR